MEKIALDGQLPPYFTKIHGKYGLQSTQRTLWKRFDGLLSERPLVRLQSGTFYENVKVSKSWNFNVFLRVQMKIFAFIIWIICYTAIKKSVLSSNRILRTMYDGTEKDL